MSKNSKIILGICTAVIVIVAMTRLIFGTPINEYSVLDRVEIDNAGHERTVELRTSYAMGNSKDYTAKIPDTLAAELVRYNELEAKCLKEVGVVGSLEGSIHKYYRLETDDNLISKVSLELHDLDVFSIAPNTNDRNIIRLNMTLNPEGCEILSRGW